MANARRQWSITYCFNSYCRIEACGAHVRTGRPEVAHHPVLAPLRVTQRADYALKSVLLLSVRDGDYLAAKDIAAHYDMSPKMLGGVLWNLTAAGILQSRPGWHGGFRLALPPGAIRLSLVIAAATQHGDIPSAPHGAGTPPRSGSSRLGPEQRVADPVDDFWRALNDHIQGTLAAMTVVDLTHQRWDLAPPAPA
jgi:Rrf2 family protein